MSVEVKTSVFPRKITVNPTSASGIRVIAKPHDVKVVLAGTLFPTSSTTSDTNEVKATPTDTAPGPLSAKIRQNGGAALSEIDDGNSEFHLELPPPGTAAAHAATHRTGDSDAVQLTQAQVDNLTTDLAGKETAGAVAAHETTFDHAQYPTGPTSAKDGEVASFDGTTGKVIKGGDAALYGTKLSLKSTDGTATQAEIEGNETTELSLTIDLLEQGTEGSLGVNFIRPALLTDDPMMLVFSKDRGTLATNMLAYLLARETFFTLESSTGVLQLGSKERMQFYPGGNGLGTDRYIDIHGRLVVKATDDNPGETSSAELEFQHANGTAVADIGVDPNTSGLRIRASQKGEFNSEQITIARTDQAPGVYQHLMWTDGSAGVNGAIFYFQVGDDDSGIFAPRGVFQNVAKGRITLRPADYFNLGGASAADRYVELRGDLRIHNVNDTNGSHANHGTLKANTEYGLEIATENVGTESPGNVVIRQASGTTEVALLMMDTLDALLVDIRVTPTVITFEGLVAGLKTVFNSLGDVVLSAYGGMATVQSNGHIELRPATIGATPNPVDQHVDVYGDLDISTLSGTGTRGVGADATGRLVEFDTDTKDVKVNATDTAEYLNAKIRQNGGAALSEVDGGGGVYHLELPPVGAPGAHAATHRTGGGDAVQLTQAQVDNLTTDLAGKEPVFTKNTGFNKDLGIISGTVSEGDHDHDGTYADKENGFDNRTDSTVTFTDGTRTFQIEPTTTDFTFYASSTKYTKSSPETVTVTDTEGLWFFYYDPSGVLQATQTFTDAMITINAFIALIYWDATNNKAIVFAEERHGNVMDSRTHAYNHNTYGTRYGNGLLVGDVIADGDGNVNTSAQFSVAGGVIWDEDIDIALASQVVGAAIPFFYRDGASGLWRRIDGTGFIANNGGVGTLAAYNNPDGGGAGIWGLTSISNNDFLCMHLYATNDFNNPFFLLFGQAAYSTSSAARSGALTEILGLATDGMPIVEFKELATFIVQTSNNYSNTPQSRIVSTDDGADYLDWRALDAGIAVNIAGATLQTAIQVPYDNTVSGLTATEVQAGLDELHSEKIEATGVTYENLNTNSDVGTGATQVAQGDHTHADLHTHSNKALLDTYTQTEVDITTSITHAGTTTGNPHNLDATDVGAAPTSHTHTLADVTDSGTAAALNVGTVAGTVAAGDHNHTGVYEPSGTVSTHAGGTGVHTIAGTSGLQAALDAKGQVDSVVGGTDITVDDTDPANPIVNYTGSGGAGYVATYRAIAQAGAQAVVLAAEETVHLTTDNTTATITLAAPAAGEMTHAQLRVTDGGAGNDLSFPVGAKWATGSKPDMSTGDWIIGPSLDSDGGYVFTAAVL